MLRGDWPPYMDTVDEEEPWHAGDESWFTQLLPMPPQRAQFYKVDCWHVVNLGVGRSFAANALVEFLRYCEGGGIDERLQSMSRMYSHFCSSSDLERQFSTIFFDQYKCC